MAHVLLLLFSPRAMFIASFACMCMEKGNTSFTALILAWGLLTSFSRVLLGRHYLGDVIAGVLLGVVITGLVTQVGETEQW